MPALAGEKVYVHLDLDVLDPERAARAVRGPERTERDRPADAARRTSPASATCVGVEVTAFEASEDEETRAVATALVASIVAALLP